MESFPDSLCEFVPHFFLSPLLIFQGRQSGIWVTRRLLLDAYRLPLLNHAGRFGHVLPLC